MLTLTKACSDKPRAPPNLLPSLSSTKATAVEGFDVAGRAAIREQTADCGSCCVCPEAWSVSTSLQATDRC